MTMTIHDHLEQGTQQWLDARCGLLTASTIGKLITPSTLKVADNETSRGLTLTLAAERITGHVEYVHPTWDMQRGTEDEPYARDAYAEFKSVQVVEVGFITLETPKFTLGYSPDGLVGDDGLIEIKSRKPKEQLATFLSDRVPAYNMAQIQAGLFVTGREWCDYVSFAAGLPLYVKRVHWDSGWFEAITNAATEFETNVGNIITDMGNVTTGLPKTERRAEIQEITF